MCRRAPRYGYGTGYGLAAIAGNTLAEAACLSSGVCVGFCYGRPAVRARIRSASRITMSLLRRTYRCVVTMVVQSSS